MQSSSILPLNQWLPFRVRSEKGDAIRALSTPYGVGDRLRVVAFAELQAREAFLWGAENFSDAPLQWREDWARFAAVEDRHAQMLLDRMDQLGILPGDRWITDKLFRLCRKADDPVLFLFLLSSAEERGMESGFILGQQMKSVDPVSASIFDQIAQEEVEHVNSAKTALGALDVDPLRERARILSSLL